MNELNRLLQGNEQYVRLGAHTADVSAQIRSKTVDGQHPYAVVITCSDSRVVPEVIFNAAIGDLFVVRLAGNVADEFALGSVEYAVSHLGCKLVVVLGHEHCGAVHATLHGGGHGHVKSLTDAIAANVGDEKDEEAACIANVKASAAHVARSIGCSATVVGAIYRLASGKVDFDI